MRTHAVWSTQIFRKRFYLHLFAKKNKTFSLSFYLVLLLSGLLPQTEVESKRKNVFSS